MVAVALQYRRYGIPIWELIAEGSLGLMMAVRKFDPERGTRFVTYAGYWIRAYVLDLVVKLDQHGRRRLGRAALEAVLPPAP